MSDRPEQEAQEDPVDGGGEESGVAGFSATSETDLPQERPTGKGCGEDERERAGAL